MADKNLDPKDIRAFAEEYKKDQGDYNNLLRDSIKYLNQVLDSYEKIQGKIQGLNKDTLNLKTINKDLEKSRQRQITETSRLKKLEEDIQKDGRSGVSNVNEYLKVSRKLSELEKRRSDAIILGDTKKVAYLNQILKYERERQDRMKETMAVDEVAYMTQLQVVNLAKQQTEYAQKQYESEKEIAKTVGYTGRLIGLMNKYLGVGKGLYSKIVLEAREGSVATKTFVKLASGIGLAFVAAGKLAISALNKLQGGMKSLGAEEGTISKLAGHISGLVGKIPLIGGILAGMIDSFGLLLDFAVGAKSEIQKMGREIGLGAQEALNLSNHFNRVSIASGKSYINSKELLKTQVDINKAMGINNTVSDANLITSYELMKFAGVELDTVTKIEQISRITGKNQSSIAGAVMHQVNNFKKLTGVSFSFQGILKEVANLSGYLGLKLAKYPGEIIKSVIAAKGLGLELKQLDSMADGFLDVESSIQKEMEAQVVTGRDINLNRARELFLNNQLVEAGSELAKQLGTSEDFLKMNRLEATSFAEAMGMSRDQVADMLKQQEHLAAFEVGSVKELQKKVALMKQQGQAQEAINKLGSEESFNKLVTASATEELSGFIEKIKQSFADLVANTKLADMVQNFIKFLSEPTNITYILNKIKDVFAFVVGAVGSMMGGIMKAINAFSGSWLGGLLGMGDIKIDEGMINTVSGIGDTIKGFDMGNLVGSTPSIGDNAVKAQTAGGRTATAQPAAQGFAGAKSINNNIVLQMDGRNIGGGLQVLNLESANIDYSRNINAFPGLNKVGKQ